MLAQALKNRLLDESVVVLGLPRGGVVVAYEVARLLRAPLDVIVVRKLGAPFQPELAMGALAEGDVLVIQDDVVAALGVSEAKFSRVVARERLELERRARFYRTCQSALDLTRCTVVVVDDGVATGATAHAALGAARKRGATRIVLGVPVASASSIAQLSGVVDDLVVLIETRGSSSVGAAYEGFEQTTDAEVIGYLTRARNSFQNEASSSENEARRGIHRSRRRRF